MQAWERGGRGVSGEGGARSNPTVVRSSSKIRDKIMTDTGVLNAKGWAMTEEDLLRVKRREEEMRRREVLDDQEWEEQTQRVRFVRSVVFAFRAWFIHPQLVW